MSKAHVLLLVGLVLLNQQREVTVQYERCPLLELFVFLSGSHTVSVHDLKQGLGSAGTSGAKKPPSSRYKLKVSMTFYTKILKYLSEIVMFPVLPVIRGSAMSDLMCSGLPGKLPIGYSSMEHHLSVFCYMLQDGIGAFHPHHRCEEYFASVDKIGTSWAVKVKKITMSLWGHAAKSNRVE